MKRLMILLIFIFTFFTSNFFATVRYDFESFASIPVLHNGRLKPIDSVARLTLINLQEKVSFKRNNQKISPSQWFFELISLNPVIDDDLIIKIIHPDLIKELELPEKDKYFSYNQIHKHFEIIQTKVVPIVDLEPLERSPYQKAVLQLWEKMNLIFNLKHSFFPYSDRSFLDYFNQYKDDLSPGLDAFSRYNSGQDLNAEDTERLVRFNAYFKLHQRLKDLSIVYFYPELDAYNDITTWTNTGSELLGLLGQTQNPHILLSQFLNLLQFYSEENITLFNSTLIDINAFHQSQKSFLTTLVSFEYYFNVFNPLGNSITIYLLALLASLFFFLFRVKSLFTLSMGLTYVAFFVHTVGLLLRVVITQRPPVTNLYSSAVFIGWFSILMALVQEYLFKNKLGPILASTIGFTTLIIAYHLSFQSDTMGLMQAVLDSNFWLSTHVITITLGYSGTFLAGFIGIYYVFFNLVSSISNELNRQLSKMVFGIICFSLLFSFIGTVLGGIWADQSWGRFWGWDPKENGALLIVLWNAFILHARLAGLIKLRGLMAASIFGNIVTSFSWFGVNMLGVGLHSYGFMEKEFIWLVGFCMSQLVILSLPYLPILKNRYIELSSNLR